MPFNSIAFVIFLLIVFLLYWSIPHKYRWGLLLIVSYYFYMSWNAKYGVLILFTTAVTYITALLLERTSGMQREIILWIGVLTCLIVLFFYKYFNFFSEALADILKVFAIPLHPVTLNLLLPVGISFYTFQTLSYVIGVYQGKVKAEHHFGIYATFISFFPQLVAGPIGRAESLLPQMKTEKKFDYDNAVYGLRLMVWGFFKKVVVADVIAVYVDTVYGALRNHGGFELAVAVFFYTIQIYCDFSGYSDIAIGTAKLMGIELMTNFKSPYFSDSIKEYWSRWHISLSTWFRDYIYIPLGGNRCSKLRHYFNLLITFLVSGLWHGANWTFVIWGGLHGFAQILENIFMKPIKKLKSRKFGRIVTGLTVFIFCNLAWVFFRADSISDAIYVITHMLDGITSPTTYLYNSIGLNRFEILKIALVIAVVTIYDYISLKHDVIILINKLPKGIRWTLGYVLVLAILYCSISNLGENQFVYFQF